MGKRQDNMHALVDFCQDGSEVEEFALNRTTGEDPGFVFIDAAQRLVFGGTRRDPREIVVITPREDGFHVTMVRASDHAAPFLVAMESNDAHELVVGTFATPLEAFQAGLAVVDGPEDAVEGPSPR
ncbi:hypothetical protein [Methylobacterium brachiatum]